MCGEFIGNHRCLNSGNVLWTAISINKIYCENTGCVILTKIIFPWIDYNYDDKNGNNNNNSYNSNSIIFINAISQKSIGPLQKNHN